MSTGKEITKDWFANTLLNICSHNTPYGEEHKIHPYITKVLVDNGFEVETGKERIERYKKEEKKLWKRHEEDENAIYATRGENPKVMINAHLDIIDTQKKSNTYELLDPVCVLTNGFTHSISTGAEGTPMKFLSRRDSLLEEAAKLIKKNEEYIKSKKSRLEKRGVEREVVRDGDKMFAVDANIGGDDKCGVAVALAVASLTKTPLKISFSSGEECGKGSRCSDPAFFEGVDFCFTPDRKNDNDLITSYSGQPMQSPEFTKWLAKIGKKFKKKVNVMNGTSYADCLAISKFVPECVNLSSGYYNPHQKKEYILLDELFTTFQWVLDAYTRLENGEFEAVRDPKLTKTQALTVTHYGYTGFYGGWGEYSGCSRSRSHVTSPSNFTMRSQGENIGKIVRINTDTSLKLECKKTGARHIINGKNFEYLDVGIIRSIYQDTAGIVHYKVELFPNPKKVSLSKPKMVLIAREFNLDIFSYPCTNATSKALQGCWVTALPYTSEQITLFTTTNCYNYYSGKVLMCFNYSNEKYVVILKPGTTEVKVLKLSDCVAYNKNNILVLDKKIVKNRQKAYVTSWRNYYNSNGKVPVTRLDSEKGVQMIDKKELIVPTGEEVREFGYQSIWPALNDGLNSDVIPEEAMEKIKDAGEAALTTQINLLEINDEEKMNDMWLEVRKKVTDFYETISPWVRNSEISIR